MTPKTFLTALLAFLLHISRTSLARGASGDRTDDEEELPCPDRCRCGQVLGGTVDIYCQDSELPSLRAISSLKYTSKIGNLIISGRSNLTEIKAGDLDGVSVENIEIFDAPLKKMDENAFQGVKGLERLFILRTPLTEFSSKFGHLPNILKLNLNKNNITYIKKGTFEGDDNVPNIINLNDNRMVDLSFIKDICNFRKITIQLKRNPLICDCTIYEVIRADVFKSKSGIFGQCAGPKYFRKTNLMDLDKSPPMSKKCNDYCAMERKIKINFDCKKNVWVTSEGLRCKRRPVCDDKGAVVCPGGVRAAVFDSSRETGDRNHGHRVTSSTAMLIVVSVYYLLISCS